MKLLLRLAFVGLALVVIGVVVLASSLDRLAAAAVSKGGTHALGVETTVDSVDLSLGGEVHASIAGLSIANPPGFDAARFAALGKGSLVFPVRGIFSDVVTVPELKLEGVELRLERRDGRTNYDVILDHLDQLGDGDGQKPAEPKQPKGDKQRKRKDDGGGKRYAIDRIVLTDVDATIDLLPLGGEKTRVGIRVPEIVLEDLQSDMTTAEIFDVVIRALLTAVLQNGAGLLPPEMLADLRAQLGALGDVALSLPAGAAQASKEILKAGEQVLKNGAGKLGEQANEALKGLGGILKKE